MQINGEELYKIWLAWPLSDNPIENPFVIQGDNWYGEERHYLVRGIKPTPNNKDRYEVELFTNKFRPITLFAGKNHTFEIIEDGRFKAINWR